MAGGDVTVSGSGEGAAADRWARALHGLYLVTLAVAFVATAVSFPVGVDWVVAGAATVVLGGADLAVRRRLTVGYFLDRVRVDVHQAGRQRHSKNTLSLPSRTSSGSAETVTELRRIADTVGAHRLQRESASGRSRGGIARSPWH
jgi:hypothetical protein